MDAVKMLETIKRICNTSECRNCILEGRCYLGSIAEREDFDPEGLVDAIERWEQEHPIKTRIQDFLEKHPNANISFKGYPTGINPLQIGYCGKRCSCSECKFQTSSWEVCWNLPIDKKVD